jgi:hypothetical protein
VRVRVRVPEDGDSGPVAHDAREPHEHRDDSMQELLAACAFVAPCSSDASPTPAPFLAGRRTKRGRGLARAIFSNPKPHLARNRHSLLRTAFAAGLHASIPIGSTANEPRATIGSG